MTANTEATDDNPAYNAACQHYLLAVIAHIDHQIVKLAEQLVRERDWPVSKAVIQAHIEHAEVREKFVEEIARLKAMEPVIVVRDTPK